MKTQDLLILLLAAVALWMLMGSRASFADVMNAPAAAAGAVANAAAPAVSSAVAAAPSVAANAGGIELKVQKFFSDLAGQVKQALGQGKSGYAAPCPVCA
jgi:hypothetical protein